MKGSPFTRLCRELTVLKNPSRADLHTHTTFSDGTHTPESLVERAIQAGLKAVAITDHDTMGAIELARSFAKRRIEVISGVEVTTEFRGHELHLLGYFVELTDAPLGKMLSSIRLGRRTRFLELARRVGVLDESIEKMAGSLSESVALGRRNLARLLIQRGIARNMHDAFSRVLSAKDLASVPKRRVPVDEAIARIRAAGGVCSWAHPPQEADLLVLGELKSCGLQAVECEYPWPTRVHGRRLREMAETLGLAVTGGSDSHDPGPRSIGQRTVTMDQVDRIRALRNSILITNH